MKVDFKGLTILVTGAGRGIGRELAKVFCNCNARVLALSRSAGPLENLKKEEPRLETVTCDVSNWDETRKVVADLGPIYGLVNNAGIASTKFMFDATEKDFDDVYGINFKGFVNVSQVVAEVMIKEKKGGSIVNISSCLGMVALYKTSVYGGSKAAMDSLTKSMAVELAPHKIRVNSVNPTIVKTEMTADLMKRPEGVKALLDRTPMGVFLDSEDVVWPTIFLLSRESNRNRTRTANLKKPIYFANRTQT